MCVYFIIAADVSDDSLGEKLLRMHHSLIAYLVGIIYSRVNSTHVECPRTSSMEPTQNLKIIFNFSVLYNLTPYGVKI